MTVPLGPLDLTGGPFLVLYIGLFVCAAVMGGLCPHLMRPIGRRQEVNDAEELAVLIGGAVRLAETVVTKLLARHALVMPGKGLYRSAPDAVGATAVERDVLVSSRSCRWNALEKQVRPHAAAITRKLNFAGLMVDDEHIRRVRTWQTAPYILLLCFGSVKLGLGVMRDRPVGYLVILLVITAGAAIIRWLSVDRTTNAGRDVIACARERSIRLRGAPTRAEAAIAVALFGTTVLIGSGLAGFHQARVASSNDGGAGGCGGDGSDGGGGCGGCGGD